jgi:hypothetical protein
MQQTVGVEVLPGVLLPANINAPSSSGLGFEVGTTARLADRLTVGLNFSWNNLEQDEDLLSEGVVLIPKGGRAAYSPEYTAGCSVDYVMFGDANGWRGRFLTTANYTPEVIAARFAATATTPPSFTTQDAFWMVNSSFVVDAPGGWTASLFVDNATNDEAFAPDPFSPRWNTRLRPRTVGLQFEYRY